MRFVAETSIAKLLVPALNRVQRDWGFDTARIKWVEDIISEPHKIFEWSDNGMTRKIPWPTTKGTVFVIDYMRHISEILNIAGGAIGNGNKILDDEDAASIIVFDWDNESGVELRIVHELLHAEDLPSDDLLKYPSKFLSVFSYFIFIIQLILKTSPDQKQYYQEKFYRWLLNERTAGRM